MDGLHMILLALFGVASCSHYPTPGSELTMTVSPGDNITLHCDCKRSTGVYIVWYRNCSHKTQPPLVLKVHALSLEASDNDDNDNRLRNFPNFQFVRNYSSETYDLEITNITDSDRGVYFCGTEERRVEDKEQIVSRMVYKYGNVTTRILFDSSSCSSGDISNPVTLAMMTFTPSIIAVSSFIYFILFIYFCQKLDKEPQILQKRPDSREQTTRDQDEDVFFTRVVFRVKDTHTLQ